MKKKRNIIITIIIVLLLLFTPIVQRYKDGGTVTFTALTYKIISWNQLPTYDGKEHKTGIEFYFFPNNFLDLDYYASR